jgi:hypothetical protein
LAQVVHFTHLNPLAAGLVGPGKLGDYRWSSLAWFPRSDRPRNRQLKLVLAAALKRTTSVSIGWLARRLEMGAPDSVGSLLHRFRVTGCMEDSKFKNVLSKFLA